MNLPTYLLSSSEHIGIYEFVSEGEKGTIRKQVIFSPLPGKDLYNLAFGDVIGDGQGISDLSTPDNGDREMILATIVSAVYAFTNQNSGAMIFFQGSTAARTRLYRMAISKYLSVLSEDFFIYGEQDGGFRQFEKNAPCNAFLVMRKQASPR